MLSALIPACERKGIGFGQRVEVPVGKVEVLTTKETGILDLTQFLRCVGKLT